MTGENNSQSMDWASLGKVILHLRGNHKLGDTFSPPWWISTEHATDQLLATVFVIACLLHSSFPLSFWTKGDNTITLTIRTFSLCPFWSWVFLINDSNRGSFSVVTSYVSSTLPCILPIVNYWNKKNQDNNSKGLWI